MRPLALDHVAFWVGERAPIVERCERFFGMHVIANGQGFTLLGRSARHGKLTLFDAPGPREPGRFSHLGLRVSALGPARARLPPGAGELFDLGEGIRVRLVEAPTEIEYELDHLALSSPDPVAAAAAYERLGFTREGETRVGVGGAHVELHAGDAYDPQRPLLNHLAVRVESAAALQDEAQARGIEIESAVDAANTRAVFLWGPDRVRVEYVEHKPGFALG